MYTCSINQGVNSNINTVYFAHLTNFIQRNTIFMLIFFAPLAKLVRFAMYIDLFTLGSSILFACINVNKIEELNITVNSAKTKFLFLK